MKTNIPQWASGPAEILIYAVKLLNKDSDTNRRLAMILVDNSVEQMIKTYLSLPKRLSGIKVSRKRIEESTKDFSSLLDLLEEAASEKIAGLDLGLLEYYHRIRNSLYHQGMGLTVERDKVEVYSEIAKNLFKKLFEAEIHEQSSNKSELLGQFIEVYNRLEHALIELAALHSFLGERRSTLLKAIGFLKGTDSLTKENFENIERFRQIRNAIVHGQKDYKLVLDQKLLSEILELTELIEEVLDIKNE